MEPVAIKKVFNIQNISFQVPFLDIPEPSDLKWLQTTYQEIADCKFIAAKNPRIRNVDVDKALHETSGSSGLFDYPLEMGQWIEHNVSSGTLDILKLIDSVSHTVIWRNGDKRASVKSLSAVVEAIVKARKLPISQIRYDSNNHAIDKSDVSRIHGASFGTDSSISIVCRRANSIEPELIDQFCEMVTNGVSRYYLQEFKEWSRDRKVMELSDPSTLFLIALRNGVEVVGILQWEIDPVTDECPELGIFTLELAVAENCRSQKIGTALLKLVEAIGRGLGCTRNDLVVQRCNFKAISFYRKMRYGVSDEQCEINRPPRSKASFEKILEFRFRKRLILGECG